MKSVTPPKAIPVYVLKMTPELAERLKGKAFGYVRLPRRLDVGSRVLLREFHGAPTGRADVCEVVSYTESGLAFLRRAWSWSKDAPEDLAALSLTLSEEIFPVRLEAEAHAA